TFLLTQAVRDRIADNRCYYQCDTTEEHQRISVRRQNVTADSTYYERQSNAHWKCHGQPRDLNCRNKQQVGHVEDDPTRHREDQVRLRYCRQILKEGPPRRTCRT